MSKENEPLTQEEEDYYNIKRKLFDYIRIIIKEYPNCDIDDINDKLYSDKEIIKYNESDAISFFVEDGVLLLPKKAYEVLEKLKSNPNYGTDLNSGRKPSEYLDTNTTYMDYIEHIIKSGLSFYDYSIENLLHEAMHICGSAGGSPLEEGINELKTRELAQKYNIKIAAYGYPKEVEIAKELQNIIGKDVMDDLTFIPAHERETFLFMRVGEEKAKLYSSISTKMKDKSKDYYNNLKRINDPYEKAKQYESIDYGEVYQIINDYKSKKK